MKKNSLILVSLILSGSYLAGTGQKTDVLRNLPSPQRESDWSDVIDSSYVDRLGTRVYCMKKITYNKELKKFDL